MQLIPLDRHWSIEPVAWSTIKGVPFERMQAVVAAMPESLMVAEQLPLQVKDGLAVIHIKGVLTKNPGFFQMLFGGTSTAMVTRAVQAARADPDVKSALLIVDGPGGSVDGLAELGDAIWALRQEKRVIAQISGMAASAHYYVASQAHQIFAHRMDMVGSIGTKIILLDASKAFEEGGLEVVVVDTGEFKSAGEFGTEITDAQRADFQRVVDGFFEDFVAMIARGRGMAKAKVLEAADGRMFLASEAVDMGLINGIRTLDETIARITATRRRAQRAAATVRGARMAEALPSA